MKNSLHPSEETLILGIQNADSNALDAVYRLYFPMILNFILNNNGTEAQAKDVFQDAVIVLYNKLKDQQFQLTCKIKTYIYSVCRRLWLKELNQKKTVSFSVHDFESFLEFEESDLEKQKLEEEKHHCLSQSLIELGEPCKSIILGFYVEKLSMDQIAKQMGYTNAANAKNQKYKCFKRLTRIFKTQFKAR